NHAEFGFSPDRDAAFQRVGGNTGMAEPCGNARTRIRACLANDDGVVAGKLGGPIAHAFRRSPYGCWNEPLVSRELFVSPHVDDVGTPLGTDEAKEFVDG